MADKNINEYEFEYTKVTKTTKVISGLSLLYGKELKEYDNIPIEDLLNQLTEDEIDELINDVDPDDSHIPPSLRCREQTKKAPTGPLNRAKLLEFLKNFALNQEDWPENKPFQPGVKRGAVWKPKETPKVSDEETRIMLDLDDESSDALKNATESDLVDLAGILGLHSLLNQDQFYASITNKGQGSEAKFESIVKATVPKRVPNLPDNATDVGKTMKQVSENDKKLQELNWNNIKHIPRDSFKKLFEGLKTNTTLKTLDLANTGLTDGPTAVLVEALKENKTLTCLNLESNFLSGSMVRDVLAAINVNQVIREFRASNQRPAILGNRIEMEITKLVEANNSLLRLGLHLDAPDARARIAQQIQKNIDSIRLDRNNLRTVQVF
ncbi:tropomodulin-like [Panonychus citri]|uniref:tropomodulin-like n=1 Tax=Panonychus citri TaxID=50023 RepID=UPI00230745EA|nr:tropomodulin-like [Panonychus citri]